MKPVFLIIAFVASLLLAGCSTVETISVSSAPQNVSARVEASPPAPAGSPTASAAAPAGSSEWSASSS